MPLASYNYRYATHAFVRAMGGLYGIAFYSLWDQIHGLIGPQGLLPAAAFFSGEGSAWLAYPSLLRWWNGDLALSLFCITGMITGGLLLLGFIPRIAAIILWSFYLSAVVGGQAFMSAPWDLLLLEAGLITILLAPGTSRTNPITDPPPSRLVTLLLRFLLFRLLFTSGLAKLMDPASGWRSLTALGDYFWTQPLPSWTAWYFYFTPALLLKLTSVLVLVIELAASLLIFARRKTRLIATALIVLLQFMISISGNFGFYNLLVTILCIPLLDDRCFIAAGFAAPAPHSPAARTWPRLVTNGALTVVALLILISSAACLVIPLRPGWTPPPPIRTLLTPMRVASPYAMKMPVRHNRPEIILEGSRDGSDWIAYDFRYKPGDIYRTPLFVAPHMPRLDWSMTTLASLPGPPPRWFNALLAGLLEGRPDIIHLVEPNPFGLEKPTFIRAVLYEYRFATREAYRRDYRWWERELKGLYCPVMTLAP